MKTWYKLDELCGTNTPRELIDILMRDYSIKRRSFSQSVLKQGWASKKQIDVMYSMIKPKPMSSYYRSHSRGYSGRDWDEWYDAGYEGHPGQYDGLY